MPEIRINQIKGLLSNLIFQIVGHLDEIIFLYDTHLNQMIYVSPAYEKLWGRTCRSLYDEPKSYLASIHPAERFLVESDREKHRFEIPEIEYRIIRPDGSIRWIQGRIFSIKDIDGNATRVACIARDISNQVFTEKMLRLKEQRYRALFNSGYDAVLVCNFRKEDLSDNMVEINDVGVGLTGFSRNELMGLSLKDLLPPSERQKIPLIVENLFHRRNFLFETAITNKTGQSVPVEINANLFSLENQPALIFIIRDISQRKAHEQEIREYHENLEKIELEKHIRSLYQRLIKDVEDERKKIALEIHDEIGQMLTLMRLEMESLYKGFADDQKALRLKSLKVIEYIEKLGEIARDISSNLRPDILDTMGLFPAVKWYVNEFSKHRSDLKIDFVCRGLKDKRFSADIEIVAYRIIQECLVNIAEHSKADHAVISITCSHPSLILKIMDNGIGFDIRNASLKAFTEKHGLGLTGIRERVAYAGGSLKIRSRIGKGSIIRATLPFRKGTGQ
jgi:PAS domain S-box-containing protein